MPFSQVKGGASSVVDIVSTQLRDAILRGVYAQNSPLNQDEIANWVGASRVPVREALKRLEAEGLVTQRPRRGYIVTPLDINDIEDAFFLRAAIEERAGYLAAQNRQQADIDELEQIVLLGESIDQEGQPFDADRSAGINSRFHETLFRCSGRPYLIRIMTVQRNLIAMYVRIGGVVARDATRTKREHRRIFEAFRDGNAELTAAECRCHVEHSARLLIGELKRRRET
jgi:DNA-binding GntR family transcriptional regulator